MTQFDYVALDVAGREKRGRMPAANVEEVREKLVGMSMVPVGGPPQAFKTFLEQDQQRWSALIKAADIKPE